MQHKQKRQRSMVTKWGGEGWEGFNLNFGGREDRGKGMRGGGDGVRGSLLGRDERGFE